MKDEANSNTNKEVRFTELYCGAGLADDNRGVVVEIPGPPVVTFITDSRLSNKQRELGWRLRYAWQTSCLSSSP